MQHRPISRYREQARSISWTSHVHRARAFNARSAETRIASPSEEELNSPILGRYCSREYLQLPVPGFSNLPTTHTRHPRRIGSHFRRAVLSPTSHGPGSRPPLHRRRVVAKQATLPVPLGQRSSDLTQMNGNECRISRQSRNYRAIARSRDDRQRGVLVRSNLSSPSWTRASNTEVMHTVAHERDPIP